MRPQRILVVFAWLVVGGEETEIRLLAQHLDPARYCLEVVVCFHQPGMPAQTHDQYRASGIPLDCTPYGQSFDATVAYLAQKIPAYDLVIACQAVPDVYPALERIADPPPLIEHGGLVDEAGRGPKTRTARYIGVSEAIRAAAAARMRDRPQHALCIPSMVAIPPHSPTLRTMQRSALGVGAEPLIGWVGRLDRKKRVEDVLHTIALLRRTCPTVQLLIIGGPDSFMPEYPGELRQLAQQLGLDGSVHWLGDRADVPQLLPALDAFIWLSEGEGMPHVIGEAGAARLPVVATCDPGVAEQFTDSVDCLLVPHRDPAAAARALQRILTDRALAHSLAQNLYTKVVRDYSAPHVTHQWEAVFEAVLTEHAAQAQPAVPSG